MSRSKARYSLRSQCGQTACDCRSTPSLPCRAISRRRSGRFSSFNTSASDVSSPPSPTPSEFSDVGFGSEEFDDSSSSSSLRLSDKSRKAYHNSHASLFLNNTTSEQRGQGSARSAIRVNTVNEIFTVTTNQSNLNQSKHSSLSLTNSYEMKNQNGSGYKDSNVFSNRLDEPGRVTEGIKGVTSWFRIILKQIGFPIYWCLVHIVLVEKWFLKKRMKEEGEDNLGSFVNYRGETDHQRRSATRRVTSYNSYNGQGGRYTSTPTSGGGGHSVMENNANGRAAASKTAGEGRKAFGMDVGSLFTGSSSVSESGRLVMRSSKYRSESRRFGSTKDSEIERFGSTKGSVQGSEIERFGSTKGSVQGSEIERFGSTKGSVQGSEIGRFGSTKDLVQGSESGGWAGIKSALFVWKKNGGQTEDMVTEMMSEAKNVRNVRVMHSRQEGYQKELSSGFVLGGRAAASSVDEDGFKVPNGRGVQNQKRGYGYNSQFESDDEEQEEEVLEGSRFGLCWFFKRFLVIFAIMAILFYLAYLLWPAATSLAYWTWAFVTSCLSPLVNGATGVFSFLTSSLPIWSSEIKQANVHLPEMPSPETVNFERTDGHTVDGGSTESSYSLPPVPPAFSKEDYNAILQKLKAIEETLKVHQEKLDLHEINYSRLQQQIVQLDASMKAATAKGKAPEDIFMEIMNFRVGVTSDGTTVTLKSLMNILNEKDEQADVKLDLRLQSMAEKFKANTRSLEDKLKTVDEQLLILKDDQNNLMMESETRTAVTPEVDFDKIKGSIMPDLMAEMEKQVKISCLTRDCPEFEAGVKVGGPSTADVEKLINMAIAKYDSDKTGVPDLALESAGGSILSTRCTKSSKLRNSVVSLWGFRIWSPPNNPRTVIQPGVVPGECWAFEGSVGDVVISLVAPSIVTGFTVEHIPKAISPYGNIDSAPYSFQVLGLNKEEDLDTAHDYGTFRYEDNGESLQYFSAANITTTPYPIVELKILSNHGNLLHTCLYRFRVHGALAIGGSQFTATVQTASEA